MGRRESIENMHISFLLTFQQLWSSGLFMPLKLQYVTSTPKTLPSNSFSLTHRTINWWKTCKITHVPSGRSCSFMDGELGPAPEFTALVLDAD